MNKLSVKYKLSIAPLSPEAQYWLGSGMSPVQGGVPRATLEIPLATHAILPGFYYHAERRVPLRYHKPKLCLSLHMYE